MTDASSRPGRPWGFTAAAFRENRVNVGCRLSRQLRPLFFVKVFVISRLMSRSAAVLTCRRLGFPGTMTEQQSPPEQMATGEGAGERGGNYKVPWGQLVTDGLGVMLEVTVTLVPVSERCRLYWGNERPPAVPAQQLENSAPRPPSCRGRGRRLPPGGLLLPGSRRCWWLPSTCARRPGVRLRSGLIPQIKPPVTAGTGCGCERWNSPGGF